MHIQLKNAGKRYNREWIFRHLSVTIAAGARCAITGANGSGKSTLLQLIAAAIEPSEGTIEWTQENKPIAAENMYRYIGFCAPYLQLIEEMTAMEFLVFHNNFKPLSHPPAQILEIVQLSKAKDKAIQFYSSGMKQRLKLAQAIFTLSPLLLLDEPCSNFDLNGIELYHHLIENYTKEKTLVVSSNDENEYRFCGQVISISDYKNFAATSA